MSKYIFNKTTGKIELHFDKAEYLVLPETSKKEIKSSFLFSRGAGAWVSRCKFPNLWKPEQIAKKLGLENAGTTGKIRSFEESQEIKIIKAERKVERYEYKAKQAGQKAEQLQTPVNSMFGDEAFFTQPNINSSKGRAFTNRRNKMLDAYERGFEHFKKSEYYQERAEIARQTAENTKPTSKVFCVRRIKEAEKIIEAQKKAIENYEKKLTRIEGGETIKDYTGAIVTAEEVNEWIDRASDILESAVSKSVYYHNCLETLGGVTFSRENIEAGNVLKLTSWGEVEVIKTNPKNITFKSLSAGIFGWIGRAPYAEIEEVIK